MRMPWLMVASLGFLVLGPRSRADEPIALRCSTPVTPVATARRILRRSWKVVREVGTDRLPHVQGDRCQRL